MISEITALFEPGRRIAVDLAGVTVMDASGAAACLTVQQHAEKAGCAVAFAQPQGIVARVLQLLDLDRDLLGWMEQP